MYAVKNLKDIKQKGDIAVIYEFLIFIFIINTYMSGAGIGYIILMTVLLFMFLNMVRHIR